MLPRSLLSSLLVPSSRQRSISCAPPARLSLVRHSSSSFRQRHHRRIEPITHPHPQHSQYSSRHASTSSSTSQSHSQQSSQSSRDAYYAQRNRSLLLYTTGVLALGVGITYAAVPLYRIFCSTTGYGGVPLTGTSDTPGGRFSPEKLIPFLGDDRRKERRIRVSFNADVSDALPWKFTPLQREVRVRPGESALAFYTATNRSKKDIIGIATYNVTPNNVRYLPALFSLLSLYLSPRQFTIFPVSVFRLPSSCLFLFSTLSFPLSSFSVCCSFNLFPLSPQSLHLFNALRQDTLPPLLSSSPFLPSPILFSFYYLHLLPSLEDKPKRT